MVLSLEILCFNFSNASCSFKPQWNCVSWRINSRSSYVREAYLEMNFARLPVIPRKRRIADFDVGAVLSLMALTLSGVGVSPCGLNR